MMLEDDSLKTSIYFSIIPFFNFTLKKFLCFKSIKIRQIQGVQ